MMKRLACLLAVVVFVGCMSTDAGVVRCEEAKGSLDALDMDLMLRRIENIKSTVRSVETRLSHVDRSLYRDEVQMIAAETESLKKEADCYLGDLQALRSKLEADAWSSVKRKDAEILSRMHSLIIPKMEFGPSNTVKDAVHFFKQTADNSVGGNVLKIEFDLTGVALGWADDWEDRKEVYAECDNQEKPIVRYKRLPVITAEDISFCDAIDLVFGSVNCCWDLRAGTVFVYLGSQWNETLETCSYPAPLKNPDRDWLKWLAAHDIRLPQGSLIVYDKQKSKLHVTTTHEWVEKFRRIFPVLYYGDDK